MHVTRRILPVIGPVIGLSMLAAAAGGMNVAAAQEAQQPAVVKLEIVDHAVPKPLTGEPGDPRRGRYAVIKQGNCLACHVMPIPEEQFHGHIGPDLHGVASRLNAAELRLRVADPKAVNPETMMPAFHRVEGLHRVAQNVEGKPILTAQEVEDVVAYLLTLK